MATLFRPTYRDQAGKKKRANRWWCEVTDHIGIRRRFAGFTPDEVAKLLASTERQPVRYGMTGHERSLLYRLAVETGLRRNELASLTVSSFDFDRCTVTVAAAYSKHRRQDVLPLKPQTAAMLKDFVAGKLPDFTDRKAAAATGADGKKTGLPMR